MMTTTAVQLQVPSKDMTTSLEEEIIHLTPSLSTPEDLYFHDAPEQAPEPVASSFDKLPAAFQDLLLISIDPETFASLSLVNRQWRRRTDNPLIYSFHLAKCTAAEKETQKQRWSEYKLKELAELKRLFAREAKRNLFSVYNHSRTTYRLTAPKSDVSASAVPHGEAFAHAFSTHSSKLAITSSSRMFIFDLSTTKPSLLAVFELRRRPTAVALSEDGRTLIVLSPEWRVSTYNVHRGAAQLIHTYILDEPATALALSPDCSLLAAALSHGIEFFALDEVRGAASRRKLACEPVSHLRFASDSSFLLGTNIRSVNATTTMVNAPSHLPQSCDEDDGEDVSTAQVWLSQPLFPSSFGKTTHASPVAGEESCVFAYDAPAETYGLLDFQKMKFVNSAIKADSETVRSFAGAPSVTSDACLAALPLSGQGVQLVSLPLDRFATRRQRSPSVPALYHADGEGDINSRYHQRWLEISEKGLAAEWTSSRSGGQSAVESRLIVTASNESNGKGRESEAMHAPYDSGTIHLFDFGYNLREPETQEEAIDLSAVAVTHLEEGSSADDAENALARASLGSRSGLGNVPLARSVTSAKGKHRRRSIEKTKSAESAHGDESIAPEERHLDAPYHPSDPRPQGTLLRQRTANRARDSRPRSMPMDPRPSQLRDPMGRGEIPDESDTDGWVPPPPEYAKDTDEELPEELKRTLVAPRIPNKSPARKSASTPNLLLDQSREKLSSEAPASRGREPKARPRPNRVRTFVENARNSIFGMQSLRRTSSGPLDSLQPKTSAKATSNSSTSAKESNEFPALPSDPPPAQPRPSNGRRKSLLERPLSVYTQLRPANARSVSQPLEREVTREVTPSVPFPQPQADSPTIPSPQQMLSLHRRQTSSGSIPSVRSDASGPPRAAIGAHRRGTNTMPSPWASSLMLNTVDEDGDQASSSRPISSYAMNGLAGSPSHSRPISLNMNGPGPSGSHAFAQKPAQQESSKENRPPTRLQEASMESSRGSTSRPNTRDAAETQNKRRSFMPGSRLASIPSVGSLLTNPKSRANSKSPAPGIERKSSKRVQRKGSVRKTTNNAVEKETFKKRLGGWRKKIMANLESV